MSFFPPNAWRSTLFSLTVSTSLPASAHSGIFTAPYQLRVAPTAPAFSATTKSMPRSVARTAAAIPAFPAPTIRSSVSMVFTMSDSSICGASPNHAGVWPMVVLPEPAGAACALDPAVASLVCWGAHPAKPAVAAMPATATAPVRKLRREMSSIRSLLARWMCRARHAADERLAS